MSAAISTTREQLMARLEKNFPDVEWYNGRLVPAMASKTKRRGGISTLNEIQATDGWYRVATILINLYLPMIPSTDNFDPAIIIVDPAEIEEFVQDILTDLATVEASVASWYVRPNRIDYPPDPNGQQTRAEMQLLVYDQAYDE